VLYRHIKKLIPSTLLLCIYRKLYYSGNMFRRILVIFLSVTEGKWSNEALKSNVKIYIYTYIYIEIWNKYNIYSHSINACRLEYFDVKLFIIINITDWTLWIGLGGSNS